MVPVYPPFIDNVHARAASVYQDKVDHILNQETHCLRASYYPLWLNANASSNTPTPPTPPFNAHQTSQGNNMRVFVGNQTAAGSADILMQHNIRYGTPQNKNCQLHFISLPSLTITHPP